MLPFHNEPDEKNGRADYVMRLARTIRARLEFGMPVEGIHDDLVPELLYEDEFFLALTVAKLSMA